MKICPHCNQENPKGRILCIHCGLPLEKETKNRIIFNSIWGIVGGFILILLDTDMVLSLGHVIPIPYGLSFIGIGTILYYSENIINYVMPAALLETVPAKASMQTILDDQPLSSPIIFALIAGVISAAIWYEVSTLTKYHFAILSILVGWIIGKIVAIGSGQRRELSLQVTSALLGFAILMLTEYFIMRDFFVHSISQQKFSDIPLLLSLDTILSLLSQIWKNEPITILFWIISFGLAFAVPGGLYINKPAPTSHHKEKEPA